MDMAHSKELILGTAMWGWGTDQREALSILDRFVSRGGSRVDTAVNYPIDREPSHWGLALDYICEWVRINGPVIHVNLKVGALDNSGAARQCLEPIFLSRQVDQQLQRLGNALHMVSVHWDNRDEGDESAILDTLGYFRQLNGAGIEIGLSGVRQPQLYASLAPDLKDKWVIQAKCHKFIDDSLRYRSSFPENPCWAYGINAGGMKPETTPGSSFRLRGIPVNEDWLRQLSHELENTDAIPKPESYHHLALMHIWQHPGIRGVILGPRNGPQLGDTLAFWERLLRPGSENV
jgi:hypothetical protein